MAQIGLSVKGLTDESMSQEQQIKRVISYLRKLEDELRYVLSNLDEGNLSQELTQVIDSKAAKSETKIIEDAVAKTRSEMKRDGQQIELSVQRILDGEDSVSALSTGNEDSVRVTITKDTFIVNVDGGEEEMMIDETGASFRDLQVRNSFYAPGVARSLDGTEYSIGPGGDYPTLTAFAEAIRGRVLLDTVVATMTADTNEDVVFRAMNGCVLAIDGGGHTLTGSITLDGVSTQETVIHDLTILAGGTKAPLTVDGCEYTSVLYCTINANATADTGIIVRKTALQLEHTEIMNASTAIDAQIGSSLYCADLSGVASNCLSAEGSEVYWHGTRPSGLIVMDGMPSITTPEDLSALTVDYGHGEPPQPTSVKFEEQVTKVLNCQGSGSWAYWPQGSMRQGAYNNAPNKGCMWWDNDKLRSMMAGKTVTACTLTLKRETGVGRTAAVDVTLRGLTLTEDNAYGTILTSTATDPVYGGIVAELGSINRNETVTFDVPLIFAQKLISGEINGFCLYNAETKNYGSLGYSYNYARMCGTDGDTPPVLSITAE